MLSTPRSTNLLLLLQSLRVGFRVDLTSQHIYVHTRTWDYHILRRFCPQCHAEFIFLGWRVIAPFALSIHDWMIKTSNQAPPFVNNQKVDCMQSWQVLASKAILCPYLAHLIHSSRHQQRKQRTQGSRGQSNQRPDHTSGCVVCHLSGMRTWNAFNVSYIILGS